MEIKSKIISDNAAASSAESAKRQQLVNKYGDGKAGAQNAASTNASDTITFSNASRDLLKASSLLEKDDEVRAKKVQDIKARVQAGTYNVDSREVASSMISFIADGSAA